MKSSYKIVQYQEWTEKKLQIDHFLCASNTCAQAFYTHTAVRCAPVLANKARTAAETREPAGRISAPCSATIRNAVRTKTLCSCATVPRSGGSWMGPHRLISVYFNSIVRVAGPTFADSKRNTSANQVTTTQLFRRVKHKCFWWIVRRRFVAFIISAFLELYFPKFNFFLTRNIYSFFITKKQAYRFAFNNCDS